MPQSRHLRCSVGRCEPHNLKIATGEQAEMSTGCKFLSPTNCVLQLLLEERFCSSPGSPAEFQHSSRADMQGIDKFVADYCATSAKAS